MATSAGEACSQANQHAWRAAGVDVDDGLGACFWLGGEQTVLEPNKLTPAGADVLIGSVLDPVDLDWSRGVARAD